jgi:hypothetical protein
VGQAQAFGRAPLMDLEFTHGTFPLLRSNARDCGSVPRSCQGGQVAQRLPGLLFEIAGNVYRYRVPASLRR